MLTLRNKLYESLLDDEEDLVNNDTQFVKEWADKLYLRKVNTRIPAGTSYSMLNTYNEIDGKIITSTLNPNYTYANRKKK